MKPSVFFLRVLVLLGLFTWCELSPVWARDRPRDLVRAPGNALDTIVPRSDHISDTEARLLLARLLSHEPESREQSLREYGILRRQQPRDPQIRLEMAQVLMALNRYFEAEQELNALLALQPDHARTLLTLAQLALYGEDYAKAISLYTGLEAREGLDLPSLIHLAQAYTWSQQYEPAIQTYHRALEAIEEPDAPLLTDLGNVYLYAGDLQGAAVWYRKALKADPRRVETQRKLGLTLSWLGQDQEALALLLPLSRTGPQDKEAHLEIVRLYARTGQGELALKRAEELARQFPEDPHILLELATQQANVGHAARARNRFLEALRLTDHQEEASLVYANQMKQWGDFYGSEALYQAHLERHPEDTETLLNLAQVLASAQNHARAEGIYLRLLLQERETDRAMLGLARNRLQQGDLQGAVTWVDEWFAKAGKQSDLPPHPEDRALASLQAQAQAIQGEALVRLNELDRAFKTYQQLFLLPGAEARGLLGQGKIHQLQNDREAAMACFSIAHQWDPEDLDIRYHFLGEDQVISKAFLDDLLKDPNLKPMDLVRWGQIYARYGHYERALACFQDAVTRDPDCFPARLALAETLGIAHQYSRALEELKDLAQNFPGNVRVWITYARVLAWSGRHEEALEAYETIHAFQPADPLPRIEAARTATWGKDMPKALEWYKGIWASPVDEALTTAIGPLIQDLPGPVLTQAFEQLEQTAEEESIYTGYEAFRAQLPDMEPEMPPASFKELHLRLIDLHPSYVTQKSASLESQAKDLAWNRRFLQASEAYELLTDVDPGNQEALFDQAQVNCAMGLCDREAPIYERLLAIDPMHHLAGMALERQRIRANPALSLDYGYWNEQGRDGLDQITRHRTSLSLDVPVKCRHHIRLGALYWMEDPKMNGIRHHAYGFSLGVDSVLTPYLKGALNWTHKNYTDSKLEDTNTGSARLWVNLKDHLTVGIGYERADELNNEFGIQQGIQSNALTLELSSFLNRELEVRGLFRHLDYTDQNSGQFYKLVGNYALTDHPRTFKVGLQGEYRNTRKRTIYEYEGGELVNLIHPYWTPQDYYGGALTLEWHHDLSPFLFCGSQLHFYRIQLSPSYDSEQNPGLTLQGEWHYEFKDHWTASLKGMIHRSKLWNAQGFWASLSYRF